MTAPLEALRMVVASAKTLGHSDVWVSVADLSAAIAAIEERGAEIKTLTRWRKYLDAITFSVLNEQQYPDAVAAVLKMQREISTLTPQLAEARGEGERLRAEAYRRDRAYDALHQQALEETRNLLVAVEVANERKAENERLRESLDKATAQRDAMRGALEKYAKSLSHGDIARRALGAL